MSRRAATATTSILRSPSSFCGVADDLPVEYGLVERHRDVVLGLEADRRLELVAVLDRRQAQRANGDALVGDAQPDVAGELVLGEELLERSAQRLGVDDLALAEDPWRERHDAAAERSRHAR